MLRERYVAQYCYLIWHSGSKCELTTYVPDHPCFSFHFNTSSVMPSNALSYASLDIRHPGHGGLQIQEPFLACPPVASRRELRADPASYVPPAKRLRTESPGGIGDKEEQGLQHTMQDQASSTRLDPSDVQPVKRFWYTIPNGHVGDWRLQDEEFINSFRLPGADDKNDQLAALHPLMRDSRIQFFEQDHTYVVDGTVWRLSVSGLLKRFAHEFNADEAIATMKRGHWPREAYMHSDGIWHF